MLNVRSHYSYTDTTRTFHFINCVRHLKHFTRRNCRYWLCSPQMLTGGKRVRELRRVRPQLHLVAEGRTTQSRDRQRCSLHHRRQRLRLPQVRPNPWRLHHRRLRMWYNHTLALTCWSLTTEKLTSDRADSWGKI